MKPFPIPIIKDLLLKLEGFRCVTCLHLTMGYYHITLCPISWKLCVIILPREKFEYQKLPMGLCNSPDFFERLLNGLEYVRAYIYDHVIICNGNFEDHLNKVKIIF